MNQITPIAAFEDNYIWALCQPDTPYCLVVDPGDAEVVIDFLLQHSKQLHTILVTHHHSDHTGGIMRLREHFPDVQVVGPASDQHRINGLTQLVEHGDVLQLADFNLSFEIIALPGHTLGHIAFYSAPILFCGDTLFSAGCGKLFEGSPEQMWYSLQKLMVLPGNTQIYCTHEYTQANIKFAMTIEPENQELLAYQQHCTVLRHNNKPTLPTTMAKEKQINPFLRCEEQSLQQHWQKNSALSLFSWLRATKDHFKA